jgi:GNAT superfamily N-acetyltransferase
MEFHVAAAEHLPALCKIVEDAKAQLKRMGVDQWQKGYPTEATWVSDIEKGISWVAVENGEVLGAFMFQTAPEAAYAKIDGAWLTEGTAYASLHRVCVAESSKGQGVAGELFRYAFKLAKQAGCPSVRIDTHAENLPMQRALEKAGFTPCGTIFLIGGWEDGDPRRAYEKIL